MNMTFYRKYRPQKLEELDNTEVRERLIRVFSSSFTPHALLFTGPKGTGKTSAARIVAKVINCEKKIKNKKQSRNRAIAQSNIEPCNKCETCISIAEGRNLDVLEIDAASNRGIDEIRDLREKIKLAPVSASFKVYIIDEVHMLTAEAFNALLKTLEEPPPHAIFILATTEGEKLPATIVSRCITFNFKRAQISEIIHCLKRVAKGEKLTVSDEFLHQIAQSAEGSFRDGTKILEQAILEKATAPEKLTILLGRDSLTAVNFLRLLSSKNVSESLDRINKMSAAGVNIRFLVEDILRLLHEMLLIKHNVGEGKSDATLSSSFETKEILVLIKLFSKVFVELKNTAIPQLPLEVAVVEWCETKSDLEKGGANV